MSLHSSAEYLGADHNTVLGIWVPEYFCYSQPKHVEVAIGSITELSGWVVELCDE